MSISLKAAMGVAALMVATQAAAQVTLYSRDGFHGEQFTIDGVARNLDRIGFNDSASSAVVTNGSWEVCQDAAFNGRCAILRPGEYPTLASMGLDDEVSSVRPVEEHYSAAAPTVEERSSAAAPGYYADRPRERLLYEAPVVAVTRYGHPDYWDVTYAFRGVEHHVALASPPGSTITVDAYGQPRG